MSTHLETVQRQQSKLLRRPHSLLGPLLPDFSGLNTFSTVILQVHVADLPHAPRLGHPHVLTAVAEARNHLVHLTPSTHGSALQGGERPAVNQRGGYLSLGMDHQQRDSRDTKKFQSEFDPFPHNHQTRV